MMNTAPEPLGRIIERGMALNGLNNSQLAVLTGFSEATIRNLKKFGVDPRAPVPTIQLLVAVSNILKLHPVRTLQLAGHLPTTVYSTPHALGEYVGTRFEALPLPFQDQLLNFLAGLEQAAGLENFGATVKRLIPEAEALGQKRLTLVENLGLAIGKLTGITTEQLLLFALERLLTALFPGETFSQEQIARVAQHPVTQALMAVLLPRRDILPGLEKLYFLLFFDTDRFLPEERRQLLQETWRLLKRASETAS
ncbi:MAG: hypothetical protein ACYDBJ_06175 [Aggregatilineales bacterium]